MPKKLYISSNERIDKLDFDRSSKDYTQEADRFARQKLLQARQTVVVSGFRIELSDQAANPGEFTIYNGVAIDRAGVLLNNEQQLTDSRTFTLSGANLSFYIEVEFVETPSDVDARAFWDPTFSGNTPKGKEFSLNIATRLTPDWQIVNPVNIVNFDVVSNPNSNLVPVAALTTDASNKITGISLVNAATVLEEDVAAGVSVFKVLDSTLFPANGTATLGVGTTSSEPIDIIANDYANGLISTLNPLTNSHQAGAILKEVGVPAFTTETTLPIPTTGEDRRRGLYKGDEIRGSALSASKEVVSDRDDLDIKSLKDYIDFDSAQRREMKFGSLRSDVNSSAPPTSSDFTSARHYDFAGSITGAKTYSITIGDNVTSRGDFNSTADDLGTILQQAHNLINGTSGGSIYVKAGTYVWDSTLTINRPLLLEFDAGVVFSVAGTYTSTAIVINTASKVEIVGMPWVIAAPKLSVNVNLPLAIDLIIRRSVIGSLDLSVAASGSSFLIEDSVLRASPGFPAIDLAAIVRAKTSIIRNSRIEYIGIDAPTVSLVTNCNNTKFIDCVFDATVFNGSAGSFIKNSGATTAIKDISFERCKFISTNPSKVKLPFDFNTSVAGGINGIIFRDCYFDFEFAATVTQLERTVLAINHSTTADPIRNVLIDNCDFSPLETTHTITGSNSGTPVRIISFETNNDLYNCVVRNCTFGKSIDGDTVHNHFVNHIYISSAGGEGVLIEGNSFSTFTQGAVRVSGGGAISVANNFFNVFATTATTDIVTGIYVSGSLIKNVVISNNQINIQNNSSVSAYGIWAVSKLDSLIIEGNDITINNTQTAVNNSDIAINIDLLASTTTLQKYAITGNTCNITGASPSAITVTEVIPSPFMSCTISSNIIFVNLTAAFTSNGITFQSTGTAGISNNTIVMESNNISATSVYGVVVDGSNITIKGNNITQKQVSNQFGISFKGTRIVVVGNTIEQISPSTAAVTSVGIVSELDSSNDICKFCSIVGNSVSGGERTRNGIRVTQFSGGGVIRGLNISNNAVENKFTLGTVNNFIQVITYHPTNINSGIVINGNTCIESLNTTGGYDFRVGIEVKGFSTNYILGVNISNNSITGEIDLVSFDRQISSAAISVENSTQVVINSNVCSNWSDISNGGTGISVVSSQEVNIQQNVLSPVPASGSWYAVYTNLVTSGIIANNISIGSNSTEPFRASGGITEYFVAFTSGGSASYNTNRTS